MGLVVGFDASAAARQRAGIGRYVRQLLDALSRRNDDLSYSVFYWSGGTILGTMPLLGPRFRVRSLPVSDRIVNAVWHKARIPFPVQGITGPIGVYHSPDFTLPPVWRRPTILTIHDLAFLTQPDCAYPTLRAYLERVVPRSAKRATAIIAVSESTRRDIIEHLDVPPERVVTVLEGVGAEFRRMTPSEACPIVKRLGVTTPYVLTVGTLEPRKNYVRLLQAFARLRARGLSHSLVIAGGRGWMYEPVLAEITRLKLETSVKLVQPEDGPLIALYSSADAFIYPSLYEGFGIPPLEALACGVPVACSGTSSLPEVVGNAALLFDPLDVENIAESLWTIIFDTGVRASLGERGPGRASQFSWDRVAGETVKIYESTARA